MELQNTKRKTSTRQRHEHEKPMTNRYICQFQKACQATKLPLYSV